MDEIDYFEEEPVNAVGFFKSSRDKNKIFGTDPHVQRELKELNRKLIGLHKDLEKLIALAEANQKS